MTHTYPCLYHLPLRFAAKAEPEDASLVPRMSNPLSVHRMVEGG